LQAGSPCSAMGALPLTTITAIPGDVNGDSTVNLADLQLVIANLGRTSGYTAGTDVKADGVINLYDLVVVGQNWGRTQ
jgi:hypothetical protein